MNLFSECKVTCWNSWTFYCISLRHIVINLGEYVFGYFNGHLFEHLARHFLEKFVCQYLVRYILGYLAEHLAQYLFRHIPGWAFSWVLLLDIYFGILPKVMHIIRSETLYESSGETRIELYAWLSARISPSLVFFYAGYSEQLVYRYFLNHHFLEYLVGYVIRYCVVHLFKHFVRHARRRISWYHVGHLIGYVLKGLVKYIFTSFSG